MSLKQLLDRFHGMSALVVGDLMLDEYIFGKAARISPEAPVMVIRQERSHAVPGGAANVAKNLTALGAKVAVAGVVGNDPAGKILFEALSQEGHSTKGLVRDSSRVTTRKTRVIADHSHQVLRIDEEVDDPLNESTQTELIERCTPLIESVDVVVLSDYLKGAITEEVCKSLISAAKSMGKPVVVNPKPRSAAQFAGATLVSLNRREISEWGGLIKSVPDDLSGDLARQARSSIGVEAMLVTLGESGLIAVNGVKEYRVLAPKVEVYDTAGAGDTVVATVALGVAAVGFNRSVFELATLTSAMVVRHVGVAAPSQADLEKIALSDGVS